MVENHDTKTQERETDHDDGPFWDFELRSLERNTNTAVRSIWNHQIERHPPILVFLWKIPDHRNQKNKPDDLILEPVTTY